MRALVLLSLLCAATLGAAFAQAERTFSADRSSALELLPDLDQEAPWGLRVESHRSGGSTSYQLGFGSAVRNIGRGPLILDGHRDDAATPTMTADQVLDRTDGGLSVIRRVGRLAFVDASTHQHWHLLGFDRYELRRADSGATVVADRKTGFCLGDRYPVRTLPLVGKPLEPKYRSRCGLDRPGLLGIREGISVGYGDDYAANLEGQYLPLKGLSPGRYLLVHTANADRRILESSYDNNAASLLVRLSRHRGQPRVRVLGICPDSEHCAPR